MSEAVARATRDLIVAVEKAAEQICERLKCKLCDGTGVYHKTIICVACDGRGH